MFRVPLSWLHALILCAVVLTLHSGTAGAATPEPPQEAAGTGATQPALRVAMAGNYLPLHGLRGGILVGYEVDLAYALGKELGREVEFLDRAKLGGLTTVEAVQQ